MAERTIAELWMEFQQSIATSKRYERDAKIDGMALSKAVFDRESAKSEALRKELLERCKPWFGWLDNGEIYVEAHFPQRKPTPTQLRESAAVYEFIAWELEQRAKENETKPAP